MIAALGIVVLLSYGLGALALMSAIGPGGSDIQYIAAGVYATCGTVALAGCAICQRIDTLKREADATSGSWRPGDRSR